MSRRLNSILGVISILFLFQSHIAAQSVVQVTQEDIAVSLVALFNEKTGTFARVGFDVKFAFRVGNIADPHFSGFLPSGRWAYKQAGVYAVEADHHAVAYSIVYPVGGMITVSVTQDHGTSGTAVRMAAHYECAIAFGADPGSDTGSIHPRHTYIRACRKGVLPACLVAQS